MPLLAVAACATNTELDGDPRQFSVQTGYTPAGIALKPSMPDLVQRTSPAYVTLIVHQAQGKSREERDTLPEAVTSGSGFVIDDAGHVLTAGHVAVAPGYTVNAKGSDGRVYSGKVVFHDGDAQIVPGVTVYRVGGHSRGLQCVRAETANGPVLLASDASHYYENFETGKPFPIVVDLEEMLAGFDFLNASAAAGERVIPGHDPLVMDWYPAPSQPLAGAAARLDVAPKR